MGIRVNPTKAISASVSYPQLAANPTWLESVATATAIEAVFQAQWVQVRVQAETTFPDVLGVEVVTPTDLIALTTIKGFAEALISGESSVRATNKALAELATLSDTFSLTAVFQRSFADSLLSTDSTVFTSILDKADFVSPSESAVLASSKVLNDGLNLIDNMDGDIEYQVVKVVGELVLASDGQAIDFTRQSEDNVLTLSSGVLAMQDYCDITYFLEDYVGLTRSFT